MDEIIVRHDNCPECVSPSTYPTGTRADGGGASTITYRCTSCGHLWATSWGL